MLVLIPFFIYLRRATWFPVSKLKEDLSVVACADCRLAHSIASVVVLDPDRGTATKTYRPPPLVKLLYWLAFQAKFPYTSNPVALRAASYRWQIASLLTIHTFGKDLVAHVSSVSCPHGDCSFVTEFVPGDRAENDEDARRFLARVSSAFAEAGLSVWQVDPRNPHFHTNLICSPEGEFKIVDLESAVVSLLPAPGQWRSSLKSGNIPIFDDIDFARLGDYITTNETALRASLGPEGLTELRGAAHRCEQAIREWKDAEPRIWGRLIAWVYRLLDWKALIQNLLVGLSCADKAGQEFLNRGLERWKKEGRLTDSELKSLQTCIASDEMREALRHLGAHSRITKSGPPRLDAGLLGKASGQTPSP